MSEEHSVEQWLPPGVFVEGDGPHHLVWNYRGEELQELYVDDGRLAWKVAQASGEEA